MTMTHRHRIHPAHALIALLCLGGCQTSGPQPSSAEPLEADADDGTLDFGEDWATIGLSRGSDASRESIGPARLASQPSAAPVVDRPVWAVVLKTFVAEGHTQAAANMTQELPRVSPFLASAWMHTTQRGSMVLYGRYEGPEDAAAQRDLERIKDLEIRGRRVFPRAMLSRIELTPAGSRSPYALLSVRERYPNVDPLYTLQVAVWGIFEGDLTLAEIQRKAEASVLELRAQGHEAYVHHDANKELSTVTVGLFDRRAMDPASSLLSPDVEALMQQFPAHLVNGEPIQEPIDRRRPSRGTRVQRPLLVLVPRV